MSSKQQTADQPRVYSYLRFSTALQKLGDSERRQLEFTEAFAKRNGWELDRSLAMADRGVSAFRGTHRRKGVLSNFLNLVKAGHVPPGSILVVENADRLSREGVETTLRKIIFELWDFNITLQLLSPEESYPPGSGEDVRFLALLLYLSRAAEESKRKSVMVRAARKKARHQARENGKPINAQCPAWLKVVDGKYRIIPEAAKAVRTVFKLKRKGLGASRIIKKLNSEGWWSPRGNGWSEAYAKRILAWDAVIGVYHPLEYVEYIINGEKKMIREPAGDAIPNYYPPVVSEELFYSVQEKLAANKGKGGRTGRARNLFQRLCRCPYCGGPVHYVTKGTPPKGHSYLVCEDGRKGVRCKRHSIRYDEIEDLILTNCEKIRPEEVLPATTEQEVLCQSLRDRIQGTEATIRETEQQAENLIDQIAKTKSASARQAYENRMLKLQDEAITLAETVKRDRLQLSKVEAGLRSFTRWQTDLAALQKALVREDSIDVRQRMQSHLQQLIDQIEIWADGFETEYRGGDEDELSRRKMLRRNQAKRKALSPEELIELRKPTFRDRTDTFRDDCSEIVTEFAPELIRNKKFWRFVDGLIQQRMSKKGRFVRIFFKSGLWIDLVPPKSMATGKRLEVGKNGKGMWKNVRPDVLALWEASGVI